MKLSIFHNNNNSIIFYILYLSSIPSFLSQTGDDVTTWRRAGRLLSVSSTASVCALAAGMYSERGMP